MTFDLTCKIWIHERFRTEKNWSHVGVGWNSVGGCWSRLVMVLEGVGVVWKVLVWHWSSLGCWTVLEWFGMMLEGAGVVWKVLEWFGNV